MVKTTPSDKQKHRTEEQERHQPPPFWSGVITLGLVSLPVSLFPANRGKPVSLSIANEEGNQIRRSYLGEKENRILEQEGIVRGYPIGKYQTVIVDDEELEALAPEKTRKIDLRRFVPIDEINPVYFERGYFLAPDSAAEAYRLLAKNMAKEQSAGIATFVMQDQEYLIAIMPEEGILRAETLRFHDENRSPKQFKKRRKLDDPKLSERKDVAIDDRPSDGTQDDKNVFDLMQALKEHLQTKDNTGTNASLPADIEQLNRDELYEEARKQHISGRSNMTKQELVRALKQAC